MVQQGYRIDPPRSFYFFGGRNFVHRAIRLPSHNGNRGYLRNLAVRSLTKVVAFVTKGETVQS